MPPVQKIRMWVTWKDPERLCWLRLCSTGIKTVFAREKGTAKFGQYIYIYIYTHTHTHTHTYIHTLTYIHARARIYVRLTRN